MITWDEGKTSTSPVNLLNAFWTITKNEILRSKESQNISNVKKIAMHIKGEISAITKSYPNKQIAQEIGKLY